MLKEMVNGTLLRPLGYEINSVHHIMSRQRDSRSGWEQYKFIKPDGSFDYEQYRQLQQSKSIRDTDKVWCKEEVIAFLASYLKSHLDKIRVGLCHGTKWGQEIEWFMKHLGVGAHVTGTDITDWTKRNPNVIQWDFHEVKPEWLNYFDFVYSNALDHSYDPAKAVNAWMSCVRPGGYGLIEWHTYGEALTITDPFAADIVQLTYQILRAWCRGSYGIREIIPRPDNTDICSIILYKFSALPDQLVSF